MCDANKSVYRVFKKNEFIKFKKEKLFDGNKIDLYSGFIHLSTKTQVEQTILRYFNDEKKLIIVELSVSDLKDLLKWEKSRNNMLFPHFFGTLKYEWVKTIIKKEPSYEL
jgi:uncharacterized protein (DUF952 family)